MSTSSPVPRTTRWTSYTNGNYCCGGTARRPVSVGNLGVDAKYCDEYVCLCVCLSASISPEPHTRSLPNFLCMLPMPVARSSSGTLTTGRINYRREGGDGSAQHGQSVIYDFLVNSWLYPAAAVSAPTNTTTGPGQLSLLPSVGW